MRLLVRALTRAQWPLAYSQGFNPHVRLSLLMPRSVGMASDGDLGLVYVSEACDPSWAKETLCPQLPDGAELIDVIAVPRGGKVRPSRVSYSIGPVVMSTELIERITAFCEAERVVVERQRPGKAVSRPIDVRPFVSRLTVEAPQLQMDAIVEDGRTASPRDVLAALELPWEGLSHKILRTGIEIE